jgi:HAD superfamily hydrolase (TIGR01509 family)
MNKIKAIIFDFDGVICDSVNIKTEAFVDLYSNYDKSISDSVKNYHLQYGGISRFEKIKYFETVLLKNECNSGIIDKKAEIFSQLVKEKVIKSEYIKGVIEFIINNPKTPKFICTGTPENEIKDIVQQRNIYSYFTDVFGSPKSKEQIINNILVKWNLNPSEVLFFGDALTDLQASQKCGLNFIGIKNYDTVFPKNTKQIDDFFDKYLSKIQFL